MDNWIIFMAFWINGQPEIDSTIAVPGPVKPKFGIVLFYFIYHSTHLFLCILTMIFHLKQQGESRIVKKMKTREQKWENTG